MGLCHVRVSKRKPIFSARLVNYKDKENRIILCCREGKKKIKKNTSCKDERLLRYFENTDLAVLFLIFLIITDVAV